MSYFERLELESCQIGIFGGDGPLGTAGAGACGGCSILLDGYRDADNIHVDQRPSIAARRMLVFGPMYNGRVTSRAQELLREALSLPTPERADIAAELLASLDESEGQDPAAVEAAWAREIARRARRVMSGDSAGEPWEDVRARVVRRLPER